MAKSKNANLLILLIVLVIATPVFSQFHNFSYICLNNVGNYTANSTYQNNLNLLVPNLIELASSDPLFSNYSVGEQGIDKAYGLYMCRGDLDAQKCHDCVQLASSDLVKNCPEQKEAVIYYYECMVRYANRSIFSLEEELPARYLRSLANVSDPERFDQALGDLMNGLINQSSYDKTNRGFAIGDVNYTGALRLYGHMQCTPDILGSPCEKCLRVIIRNMEICCHDRVYSVLFSPSCWVRYDFAPFLSVHVSSPSSPPSTPPLLPLPESPSQPSLTIPPSVNDGSSGGMIRSYQDIFMIGLIMVLSMLFA